jgi:hypothetical protein
MSQKKSKKNKLSKKKIYKMIGGKSIEQQLLGEPDYLYSIDQKTGTDADMDVWINDLLGIILHSVEGVVYGIQSVTDIVEFPMEMGTAFQHTGIPGAD